MGRYYILRHGKVIEEADYSAWAEWYSTFKTPPCIAHTNTAHGSVATHFLAVNLSLAPDAPPLLFETEVSGGWLDGKREKYATPEAARAGHDAWVNRAREAEEENKLPPPGAGW